jgi:hypothetical protein
VLVSILGALQSLGINRNLLDSGVGGAFYGVYVASSEIKWQGDILYIIRQPNEYWTVPISTAIRDDALIVKSEITRSTKILANSLSTGLGAEHWMSKWLAYVNEGLDTSIFDYFIFLTAGLPNCTVVEMHKHRTSNHLQICISPYDADENSWHIEMSVSPELQQAIDQPEVNPETGHTRARVTFFAYKPATPSV